MRVFWSAVLYTGLSLGANAAAADTSAATAAIAALRSGDMQKLSVIDPIPLAEASLTDIDGATHSLGEYRGKIVLLNFWATWCAPCRKEMPALDRLQAAAGGDGFAVVTVATGHSPVSAMRGFFTDQGVKNLPLLIDADQSFSRSSGVVGLPTTLILDRDGNEIGRMVGPAEWDGPDAKALVAGLIAQQ